MSLAEQLRADYGRALQLWLAEGQEESRSLAYEVGRCALHQGLGILDLASLHREVLQSLQQNSVELELAVGELMLELFSPFEMTLTGYQQANEELRRVNRLLALQRDELETVNQDLEAFSYRVSHDLRAPVRRLRSISELLARDPLDERQGRYLGAIIHSAVLMDEMIEALLLLARLSRMELSVSELDLSPLALEVWNELATPNAEREVEFSVQPGLSDRGDPTLLRLVLQNLLSNAWKYTSKKKAARVAFGREGSTYFVRDDGAGFPSESAAKLFTPFERLHSEREFEGTGVGLATVQRILERHHGRIWADSPAEGGATFFFTLWDEA